MEKNELDILSKLLQDYKDCYKEIEMFIDTKNPVELKSIDTLERSFNKYLREVKGLRSSDKEINSCLYDALQNKYANKMKKETENSISMSILMTEDMTTSIANADTPEDKKQILSRLFTHWNEVSESVKENLLKIKYLNYSNNAPDCARNVLMHLTRVNLGLYDNIKNVSEIKTEMENMYKKEMDNDYSDLNRRTFVMKIKINQIIKEVNNYYNNEPVLSDESTDKIKVLTTDKN